MPKDVIRDGMNFALGLVKISGDNFNKAVKRLEKSKKLSSNEGEKMVYAWLAEQQRQLETMRKRMKKKALKTRLYSSNDLAEMNRVIQNLSRQITILENKKRKAEKSGKKKKSKRERS
ncbi:MAG: hypothetical protein WC634_00250 [archaeon]